MSAAAWVGVQRERVAAGERACGVTGGRARGAPVVDPTYRNRWFPPNTEIAVSSSLGSQEPTSFLLRETIFSIFSLSFLIN